MEKRKKNSKVLYLLIFMVVAIFTISFFSVKSIVAEGEFEEPVKSENINSTISNTVNDGGELISLEKSGMDENLYRALIEIYNKKMGYEPNSINYVTSLSTHLFSSLEITTLDLSHQNITSLTSFSWLYFNESLVELKLDFNNIPDEIVIDSKVYNKNNVIFYPYKKAICQLILHIVPDMKVEEISYDDLLLIESERGVKGFGSSGK